MSIASIVVSHLLKGLLGEFKDIVVVDKELKGIVTVLQTLRSAIDGADEEWNESAAIRDWMKRLKVVMYDLDDLLDDLRNQVSSSSLPRRFILSTFPIQSKLAKRLRWVHKALLDLAADQIYFPPLPVNSADVNLRGGSSSFVYERKVIGREGDEKAVIDLMLKSIAGADQKVPVVPILGTIGIGKTTLAQLIYNNHNISHEFELRIWISLLGVRDISHVLKDMMLQLHGDHHFPKKYDEEMQEFLEDRSLLIVLDDFKDSTLHKSALREIKDVMSDKGSAILLTTRSRKAASMIGTTPFYQLQPLSLEASYELFQRYAFHYKQKDVRFLTLAKEFVKCSSGVPLLVKTFAASLAVKATLQEWELCLNSIQAHSYPDFLVKQYCRASIDIPSHLILPLQSFLLQKECGLNVEALTCVWMALGFFYNSNDTTDQTPEYIVRKNLTELVNSALLPDVQYAPGGVVQHINFINSLYELATLSGDFEWAIVSDNRMFSGSPMYVIWDQDCVRGTVLGSSLIDNLKRFRLFMVKPGRLASVRFVRDILSCLPLLRVLGLAGCDIELLPESIGDLKHLRYLDVARNPRIKSLPDTICNLWLLQTLFLHGCSQLEELPANIGKLGSLRYLTLTILLQSLPEAIGQLTSLRTLGLTSCPKLESLPVTVKNLKNLATLAVVSCPELDLDSSSSVVALEGLDALQTLLLLHLPKFARLPSYMGNQSPALKHLQILACERLRQIKGITKYRSLHTLTVEDCPKLSDLMLADGGFQLDGLLELAIGRCKSLGGTAWIKQFVSLQSLVIDDCPKLVDLDAGFSELTKLKRLEIRDCPVLTEWFASPAGKDWRRTVHVKVIEVDGASLES